MYEHEKHVQPIIHKQVRIWTTISWQKENRNLVFFYSRCCPIGL